MKYIILAAGKGTRLKPLTDDCPKCLYHLDEKTTILQRMINLIHKYDSDANITVVGGYLFDTLENSAVGCSFIRNPFYEVTNSIASLWFALEDFNSDVTIMNGDIVVQEDLVKNIICKKYDNTTVFADSSIRNGDYNIEVSGSNVVVMSKNLNSFYGEYVGITKISNEDVKEFKEEIIRMVNNSLYDQWFESAIVQMIFKKNFILKYEDVSKYRWTEIDCVDDLVVARQIFENDAK